MAANESLSLFGMAEPVLRGGAFFGAAAVLMLAEHIWPRRKRALPRGGRWFTNAALVLIDSALVRAIALLAPVLAAVGAAAYAAEAGLGLFRLLGWPAWLEFALALLLLDFAIWLQHVVFHRVPALWRLHRVHHADRDFDVTTALRFHPFEILISALYKSALVLAFGLPAAAVIVFEIALNACAMFNHANVKLPLWADAALRLVLVTPDMHRVHHSVLPRELNTNFGFCLSVWDRLFRVYSAQPSAGHEGMTIGLSGHQNEQPARLGWSLMFPFIG